VPFRTFIQTFAVPENASETIPGVVWVTGSDIPEDLQTHYAAVVPTVAEITWTGFSGLYIYRLWAINGTVYNGWVDLDTFANPVVVEAQAIQNSYGASDTTTTIIGRDSTVDTIVAAASPTGAFYTGHGPNAASEPHRRRKLAEVSMESAVSPPEPTQPMRRLQISTHHHPSRFKNSTMTPESS